MFAHRRLWVGMAYQTTESSNAMHKCEECKSKWDVYRDTDGVWRCDDCHYGRAA